MWMLQPIPAAGQVQSTITVSDTGWLVPSATSDPFTSWTSLGNAYASDDTYATASATGGAETGYAYVYNFTGLSVPTGATILGIEVSYEGKITAGTFSYAYSFLHVGAQNFTTRSTSSVGIQDGYGNGFTSSDQTFIKGSPRNDWGGVDTNNNDVKDRDWAPTDFDSNFGVGFAFAGATNISVSLDQIRLRVTYQETVASNTFDIPTLNFTQSLKTPVIDIYVPTLAITQSLKTPSLSIECNLPALEFTQTTGTQYNTGWATGSISTVPWFGVSITNPSNAGAQDDTYASISVTGTQASNHLYFSNFGFNVPEGAAINGIEFEVDLYRTTSTANKTVNMFLNSVNDGVNYNQSSSYWFWGFDELSNSDTDRYHRFDGGLYRIRQGTYLWDGIDASGTGAFTTFRPWVPSDVNSSTFGATLYVANNGSASATLFIDHARVNVYYTVGDVDLSLDYHIPALSFTQTNAAPALSLVLDIPTLSYTQALYAPSIDETTIVDVPVISFVETLYAPSVELDVSIPSLGFNETLYAPSVELDVSIPSLGFNETLYAPSVELNVSIPVLSFAQTLYPPSLQTTTYIDVPVLGFTQTLYTPSLEQVVDLPTDSFVAGFYAPSLVFDIALPVLAFTQALHSPAIEYVYSVPTLPFSETIYTPQIARVYDLPVINFTETLHVLTLGETTFIDIPTLSLSQSLDLLAMEFGVPMPVLTLEEALYLPTLEQTIDLPIINFNETLLEPSLVLEAAMPTLSFTEALYEISLVKTTYVDVPTLIFAQTQNAPTLENIFDIPSQLFDVVYYSPELVSYVYIPAISFTQTLFAPTVLLLEHNAVQVLPNTLQSVSVIPTTTQNISVVPNSQSNVRVLANAQQSVSVVAPTQVNITV